MELDPQVAAWQAVLGERPSVNLLPLEDGRRRIDADAAAAGPGEEVGRVEDVTISGPEISARIYRPVGGDEPRPVVVYLHGGGWLLGSIDSHDAACRALANASGAAVVSVAYRRAPEHPFPGPLEDAYAALRWAAADRRAELGLDGARLAVAGDSAGGNLAAAAALLARDQGGPPLRFQLLVYPVTTTDLDLLDPRYDDAGLSRDELEWHQRHYLPASADGRDPRVSPLDAPDLRGLPPTLVLTAGCDVLRPHGERYTEVLRHAGVRAESVDYPGMPHGFFQLPQRLDRAREAIDVAGASLRRALAE